MRQMVDKRIDGGPCPRLVPPKDWPEAPAVPPPWKDYLNEEVYGPAPPYPYCNASQRLCACPRGCTVPVFGEQVVCDFCFVETSPQPHCVCAGVGYECCEHDLSDGGEKAEEEQEQEQPQGEETGPTELSDARSSTDLVEIGGKEYSTKSLLVSERCEICGRVVNPELLSVCCFLCSNTNGRDHDRQCNQRTRAEKWGLNRMA